MSQEFVQKIFSPFERERTSTVSRTQGTGLGMAITKNIVDMMGGTIEVRTEQEMCIRDRYTGEGVVVSTLRGKHVASTTPYGFRVHNTLDVEISKNYN